MNLHRYLQAVSSPVRVVCHRCQLASVSFLQHGARQIKQTALGVEPYLKYYTGWVILPKRLALPIIFG